MSNWGPSDPGQAPPPLPNQGQYGQPPYPPQGYPPPPGKSNLPWILIGCGVAGFFGIFVIGILAAIAIPNFLKFQSKAKQSEAKTNLGALFTTQVAYFGENNTYAGAGGSDGEGCFERLRWQPEGMTLYSYYCDGEVIPCTRPGCGACSMETDLSTTGDQSFVIMAVGNIDNDSTCDVWTIDDSKMLINVTNDTVN